MSERTHWQGCFREHHDCAVAEVYRCRRMLEALLNRVDLTPGFNQYRGGAPFITKEVRDYLKAADAE